MLNGKDGVEAGFALLTMLAWNVLFSALAFVAFGMDDGFYGLWTLKRLVSRSRDE